MSEESSRTVELRDTLEIPWRRKWIVVPVTDAAAIARSIDCPFMVTMVGTGTRKHLRQAPEILARVDAPVTGVVLNSVGPDRYKYQYGDAYYGTPEGEGDARPAPAAPGRGGGPQSTNGRKRTSGRAGARR